MTKPQSKQRKPRASDDGVIALEKISKSERKEIIAKLRTGGVLLEGADPDMLVQAYVATNGLPSRIVHAGEGPVALPDLTQSKKGRELLDRLTRRAERALEPRRQARDDGRSAD